MPPAQAAMFALENHVVTMKAFDMVAQAKHMRNSRMMTGFECSNTLPNCEEEEEEEAKIADDIG